LSTKQLHLRTRDPFAIDGVLEASIIDVYDVNNLLCPQRHVAFDNSWHFISTANIYSRASHIQWYCNMSILTFARCAS